MLCQTKGVERSDPCSVGWSEAEDRGWAEAEDRGWAEAEDRGWAEAEDSCLVLWQAGVVGAVLSAPQPFAVQGTVPAAEAAACLGLGAEDVVGDAVIGSTGSPAMSKREARCGLASAAQAVGLASTEYPLSAINYPPRRGVRAC